MSLGNLFLENQLASLPFRDFWKNVVNSFVGLGDFPFFGLDFLEECLVGLESLRESSLTQDPAILSEGNDKVRNRSRQSNVVGLGLCQPNRLRRLQPHTTSKTVRPRTRSPSKHFSTIHFAVCTSKAAKMSSKIKTWARE